MPGDNKARSREESARVVVVFDLDGGLTNYRSLAVLLGTIAGPYRLVRAVTANLRLLGEALVRPKARKQLADAVLLRTVAGRTAESVLGSAERFAERALRALLVAADVAVRVGGRTLLRFSNQVRVPPVVSREGAAPCPPPAEPGPPLADHVPPTALPAEADPAPLPYQQLLEDAGRTGRVLHRIDIYGSGPPVDAVSEEILNFVAGNTGQSVLDVGCGIGPYVERLTKLGRRCVGVEIDESMVETARGMGRDVRRMSAYQLEFPDCSFDSVIFVETLEHLEDFETALAEASRVARDTIVLTVPDISALQLMSKRLVVPWHMLEATHVNFFTPESLRKLLLKYASACEATRLGAFFEVDGDPVFMHAAAVAHLRDPSPSA